MTSSEPASPSFTPGYRRLVLALLTTAYAFNFIDRTIVSSLGQAIKLDLKITDTQLGLLGGLYFALLYTLLGIPLARLSERISRVNIISVAIVVWSGFTALCGAATSFASLAALRFGVGVGEAGLTPPAHALISDYYEPRKRASALSIYSLGVPVGTMIGAIAGGWLAQNYSWRVAFVALGLPGVLVALAIRLLVREPPRGHSEREGAPAVGETAPPPAPKSLRQELADIRDVSKVLFGRWPIANMVFGITLVSFAGYGGGAFVQPYFLRSFHVNYAQVGLFTGLIGGFSAIIGTALGGALADRLARAGSARWYGLVPAIGVALAYPFIAAVYTAPTWSMALFWLVFPGAISYVYQGPTYGVIQNMFPVNRRATAIAVTFLFLNLIGMGVGPPFAGWMIDHFAAFHLAHPDQPGMLSAVLGAPGADVAALQRACPGGIGPHGAAPAVDMACRGAVRLATRQGVLIAYAFGLWGALHYLLASFGLKSALAGKAA